MAATRLDVRLDTERRTRLDELAERRGMPVSEVVRSLIDDAYEQIMMERRRRIVREIASAYGPTPPDPETLCRELGDKYGPE